jgi:heptosyltransferase-1
MRVLIVKLSSLGDVVHTLPVVADIRAAHADARVDWVVEPAFAPLVARVDGIGEVIECALRRWTREGWWRAATRAEFGRFVARLRRHRYDAVIDLQGLTKSTLIAKLAHGPTYGLANRTEGASHEWPARWLVRHSIRVEPHSHALDRARELVATALGTRADVPPSFGLAKAAAAGAGSRTVVLIHGTSRADKLWPEASWIEIGKRLVAAGWKIALPQASAEEKARAEAIAVAVGNDSKVWPALDIGALVDRLAASAGAIGVDSGPSHIAVALGLPHVQIYNFPTAWRTGPQVQHGARHQLSIEGRPTPAIDAVWAAWQMVQPVPSGRSA